jgi:hypothetical protein
VDYRDQEKEGDMTVTELIIWSVVGLFAILMLLAVIAGGQKKWMLEIDAEVQRSMEVRKWQ